MPTFLSLMYLCYSSASPPSRAQVSTHVPLGALPDLMRAVGFFPSEEDILVCVQHLLELRCVFFLFFLLPPPPPLPFKPLFSVALLRDDVVFFSSLLIYFISRVSSFSLHLSIFS